MTKLAKSPSKVNYKISNWQEYNESLIKRGKVSIWLSAKLLSIWRDIDVRKITVGEQKYPDAVIEFCLIIKYVYGLGFRQTQGFVQDILALHGCEDYCIPNYSTLSRRSKDLSVSYSEKLKNKKGLHLMVDSTGLKVYGEGEWKVKKHGVSKHRTWLKLHLCVDVNTQEIVAMSLTDNSVDDAKAAKNLLEPYRSNISSMRGDGAYDTFFFREAMGKDVKHIIPPPRNAVLKVGTKKVPIPDYLQQRNKAVQRIEEIGRSQWKKEVEYHQRSLVETSMFRYKIIFGEKATARIDKNQLTEAKIKCKIINVFTNIGMPKTIKILKN